MTVAKRIYYEHKHKIILFCENCKETVTREMGRPSLNRLNLFKIEYWKEKNAEKLKPLSYNKRMASFAKSINCLNSKVEKSDKLSICLYLFTA